MKKQAMLFLGVVLSISLHVGFWKEVSYMSFCNCISLLTSLHLATYNAHIAPSARYSQVARPRSTSLLGPSGDYRRVVDRNAVLVSLHSMLSVLLPYGRSPFLSLSLSEPAEYIVFPVRITIRPPDQEVTEPEVNRSGPVI
jgi:hypothetical protein